MKVSCAEKRPSWVPRGIFGDSSPYLVGIITYNGLTGIVTEDDRGLSIVLGPVVCSRKSDTSRGWDWYVPQYIHMYLQLSLQLTGVTLCPGDNIVVVGS